MHLQAELKVERAERLVEQQDFGSFTSARAIATRCFWPPLNSSIFACRSRRGARA
jgi:hypothetical protein